MTEKDKNGYMMDAGKLPMRVAELDEINFENLIKIIQELELENMDLKE